MTFNTGLAASLLLGLVSLAACNDDAKQAPTKGKGSPPAGLKALSNSGTGQIATLEAGLAEDPENEALLAQLGDAYFESKRFDAAIPIYRRLVAVNPKDADGYNDLALSLFYVGEGEEALTTIAKANAAAPSMERAWLTKGFILVALKRYPEAIPPLNKVKELAPDGKLAETADGFLQTVAEQMGSAR